MLNKELLKTTLDLIKAKPELHDQGNWVRIEENNVCGTAMCFAGHAAILAGAEAPDPKKHYVADWFVTKDGKYLNWKEADATNEDYMSVAGFARDALGIDFETADYMFDQDRTREELTKAVDNLLNDRPVVVYYDGDEEDDYEGGCPCCEY